MTVAIKVENLSKKYLIKHEKQSAHYETFSETLIQGSKNFAKKIIHPFSGKEIDSQTQEEFWALKDINFEINQGNKVGIIGRNGAGKSTLLKILSRITEPTSGKIHINGRIASLLEVGTGFHPELTGRENIYLNGAILGMSRKEIKAKFDEIVDFSEVEKFLDTPVKRYSSGMYVRLAFAVAAHLEPDILVIDEVLAVGDVEFQKKCLGKMEDVSKEGRTILFVSHNIAVVQVLCDVGLFLTQGYSSKIDIINNTINSYLSSIEKIEKGSLLERTDRKGSGKVRICSVEISSISDNFTSEREHILVGDKVRIKIGYTNKSIKIDCRFTIYNQQGLPIATFFSAENCQLDTNKKNSNKELICELDELLLLPNRYRVNAALFHNNELIDHLESAIFFNVEQASLNGFPVLPNAYGSIYLPHRWI